LIGSVSIVKPTVMEATIYSLRDSTKAKAYAEMMSGVMNGTTLVRKTTRSSASIVAAASVNEQPMEEEPSESVTSGGVTKMIAWITLHRRVALTQHLTQSFNGEGLG